MPRSQFRFLIATALLAAVASVSVGAVQAMTAHGTPQVQPKTQQKGPPKAQQKGQPVDVLSASFVSASVGYLLAEPRCASQVKPCQTTALLRETVDGGRTWSARPGPAAPPAIAGPPGTPADAVGSILFTSQRDGYAYGPSLWHTADGGASWRRVPVPGRVAQFAVAGGRMVAVTGGCAGWGSCAFRVFSAPAGSDTWLPVAGTAVTGSGASLAVSGTAGYLLVTSADLGRPRLLAGPVNGSARWRARQAPCGHAWSAAVAAAPGSLFLGCGGEPGAGNQEKAAYTSSDGGRTWRQVASPPFGGYLGGASMTAGGTIFLSGGRMDVYISRDRGRSWHESPSLAGAAGLAGAGFSLVASTVTGTFGVAVQQDVFSQQVWLTRDGGRHWSAATVH